MDIFIKNFRLNPGIIEKNFKDLYVTIYYRVITDASLIRCLFVKGSR